MQAPTMRIVLTWPISDGKVVIGTPKYKLVSATSRSRPHPVSARTRRDEQRARQTKRKVGQSGWLFTHGYGIPALADFLINQWKAACERAGCRQLASRRASTCATLMNLKGVPIPTLSSWLGHATASFTMLAKSTAGPER